MTFQELRKLAENYKDVRVEFDPTTCQAVINYEQSFSNLILAAKYIKANYKKTDKRIAEEKAALKQCNRTTNFLLFGK